MAWIGSNSIICLEELRKTTQTLNQNSKFQDLETNPGLSEYETGMLRTLNNSTATFGEL
jgi:hypothetical protein